MMSTPCPCSSSTAAPPLRRGLRSARDPAAVLLLRAGHRRRRDAAARRQKARRVRKPRVPQLERQRLVGFQPQAHRRRDAVIGRALQVVDQVGQPVVVGAVRPLRHAGQSHVLVRVDQRRDHRLAGQVHARGTLGRLPLARRANPGEDAVLDEERRPLDRRAAVAVNQSGALEPGRVTWLLLLCGGTPTGEQRDGACDHPTRQRGPRSCHG